MNKNKLILLNNSIIAFKKMRCQYLWPHLGQQKRVFHLHNILSLSDPISGQLSKLLNLHFKKSQAFVIPNQSIITAPFKERTSVEPYLQKI